MWCVVLEEVEGGVAWLCGAGQPGFDFWQAESTSIRNHIQTKYDIVFNPTEQLPGTLSLQIREAER